MNQNIGNIVLELDEKTKLLIILAEKKDARIDLIDDLNQNIENSFVEIEEKVSAIKKLKEEFTTKNKQIPNVKTCVNQLKSLLMNRINDEKKKNESLLKQNEKIKSSIQKKKKKKKKKI